MNNPEKQFKIYNELIKKYGYKGAQNVINSVSSYMACISEKCKYIIEDKSIRCRLEELRKTVKELVYKECYGELPDLVNYEHEFFLLGENEIDEITDSITIGLLESLMRKDKSLKKTINDYARYKYSDSREKDNKFDMDITLDSRGGKLKRYAKQYMKNKTVLYKQMGILGYKNHGNTAYKKKGKRKFSYPELKFIELLHNNVFKITKMEVEYKYGVTDSGNDKNKAIKEAYEFYNSELDKVDLLSKDKDKTMEYICSCIVFHSYERLQRVKLCADIAKYLVENNLKPEDIRSSKQYKNLMAMFWVDQFDSKCGILERAYDIHNYKEKLSLIFDNDLSDQAVKFIILRCSFKRTIAGKIYNIMDCYFKKHHKKLKNEDFEYAAEMFRKTYTPYEKIDLITEGGKDDSDYEEQQKKVRMYYDYIREIFSYRKDMDYQMLNIARNELCNK